MVAPRRKSLFDFHDYKKYLVHRIGGMPRMGRGFRSQMAEVMGCQPSFVSSVLKDRDPAHLSLEQAEKLNALLEHSAEETDYFLVLILYARAGSEGLRKIFQGQLEARDPKVYERWSDYSSRQLRYAKSLSTEPCELSATPSAATAQ